MHSQLVYSVDEAARALSIGRTKLYAELAAGNLEAKKLGSRTLITRESVENYLSRLDTYYDNLWGEK